VNWRYRIYGHNMIAILWVKRRILCEVKSVKIHRVIQIKFNQLVQENVHMVINPPTKRI